MSGGRDMQRNWAARLLAASWSLTMLVASAWAGPSLAGEDSRPLPGEEYISAARNAQVHPPLPAPNRAAGEGLGPYHRLVIRGATLIDGTGAPAIGPVDIVIEQDRIARIQGVGYAHLPIKEQGRPAQGDYEIDATGM